MEPLLTTEQAMKIFQIKDSRTMAKFRQRGLKFLKIGAKDYRYRVKDIEEFMENEVQTQQFEMIIAKPIKRKTKSKTINIDFQKRKINLESNRVV